MSTLSFVVITGIGSPPDGLVLAKYFVGCDILLTPVRLFNDAKAFNRTGENDGSGRGPCRRPDGRQPQSLP